MIPLKQKYGPTALITGATSGIGKAYAEAFASQGLNLVLVARRKAILNEIKADLTGRYDVQVSVIRQDLSTRSAAAKVYEQVNKSGLDVDILVNNAGFGAYGVFDELDRDRQLAMVDLNCRTVVGLAHHFIPPMKQRGRGAVITVSSALAYFPSCHFAVYSATKAFDLLFGEALFGELKAHGIDAIAIAPTLTETNFQSESRMRPMPISMRRPEHVVRTSLRFLGRRASVVDGWFTRAALIAVRMLPRTVVLAISRWFMNVGGAAGDSG